MLLQRRPHRRVLLLLQPPQCLFHLKLLLQLRHRLHPLLHLPQLQLLLLYLRQLLRKVLMSMGRLHLIWLPVATWREQFNKS
uniref:Uncharacterized protein n=1 Tax=Medicago truncatula TaxID=3880 RepID=I3SB56_MEDTR|nr:unknown [Medicago truncatula]